MLIVGQHAPPYALPNESGHTQMLAEREGKWTVLYFYPKDDTPGCTKEACMIRDAYEQFEQMGVGVFGVSKDSPESHRDFKAKYQLPFTLLSDEAAEVIRAYEAQDEVTDGTKRVTYLIAPDLSIAKVYESVDPASHADEILRDLEMMKR